MLHPPYSPALAPSDYYLFRSLQNSLSGKTFNDDVDDKQKTSFLLLDGTLTSPGEKQNTSFLLLDGILTSTSTNSRKFLSIVVTFLPTPFSGTPTNSTLNVVFFIYTNVQLVF